MKCWCHYITKRVTADLESSPKYFKVIFVPKAFYMKPSLLERKTKLALKTIEAHYEIIKILCVKLNMPLHFLYYQKIILPFYGWASNYNSGPPLGNLRILTVHSPLSLWEGAYHKKKERERKSSRQQYIIKRVDFYSIYGNYFESLRNKIMG